MHSAPGAEVPECPSERESSLKVELQASEIVRYSFAQRIDTVPLSQECPSLVGWGTFTLSN